MRDRLMRIVRRDFGMVWVLGNFLQYQAGVRL